MTSYYLQVEGLNFDAFLGDTQDLSTIRGGGLLLLSAPRQIAQDTTRWETAGIRSLHPISLGASSGLYSFDANSNASARALRDRIENWLHRDDVLRHGTFAVEVVETERSLEPSGEKPTPNPKSTSFSEDQEALQARVRWAQMEAPSMAFPKVLESAQPCALDRLRPGVARSDAKGVQSDSVFQRRAEGRRKKQDFYRDQTGLDFEEGFSESFERLTDAPEQGLLNGKMAVFYVDGNHLGRRLRRLGDQPEALETLDKHLRNQRRQMLRRLVTIAHGSQALRETDGSGAMRLETLLWGGDEILWVVPAWAGLRLVDLFFKQPWSLDGEPVHHACGLVFCRHKAPIHRMQYLAKELAELAKNKDRGQDLIAYQVLESTDPGGDDLATYRQERCPPGLDAGALIVPPGDLCQAAQAFVDLRHDLPSRPIQRAARAIASGETSNPFENLDERLRADLDPALRPRLDTLVAALSESENKATVWLHLSELWPYLAAYSSVDLEAADV